MVEYIDHLKEHMREEVVSYLKGSNNLPEEFKGIEQEKLIEWLVDDSAPLLRIAVDYALSSGISRVCSMIRFSKKQIKGGKS